MNMEWRSEYQIKVGQSESQDLFVKVEAPSWSWSNWGIYNHFETHVTGRTIRIVPKFLFGLPIDTIGEYTGLRFLEIQSFVLANLSKSSQGLFCVS